MPQTVDDVDSYVDSVFARPRQPVQSQSAPDDADAYIDSVFSKPNPDVSMKGKLREAQRQFLPLAGAGVGSMLAAPFGAPGGPSGMEAASTAGGGAGYSFGTALDQAIGQTFEGDKPQTFMKNIGDQAKAFDTGAKMTATGELLLPAVKALGKGAVMAGDALTGGRVSAAGSWMKNTLLPEALGVLTAKAPAAWRALFQDNGKLKDYGSMEDIKNIVNDIRTAWAKKTQATLPEPTVFTPAQTAEGQAYVKNISSIKSDQAGQQQAIQLAKSISPMSAAQIMKNPDHLDIYSGDPGEVKDLIGNFQNSIVEARKSAGQELGKAKGSLSDDERIDALASYGPGTRTNIPVPMGEKLEFLRQQIAKHGEKLSPELEALSNQGIPPEFAAPRPAEIAQRFKALSDPAQQARMKPGDETEALLALRDGIYKNLKTPAANTQVPGVQDNMNSTLQDMATKINSRLDEIAPGVREKDDKFRTIANLYDQVQTHIQNGGRAEDYIKAALTSPTGKSQDTMDALKGIENITGDKYIDDLSGHFATQELKDKAAQILSGGVASSGKVANETAVNKLIDQAREVLTNPRSLTNLPQTMPTNPSTLKPVAYPSSPVGQNVKDLSTIWSGINKGFKTPGSTQDFLAGLFTKSSGKNQEVLTELDKLDQQNGTDNIPELFKHFSALQLSDIFGRKFLAAFGLRDILMGKVGAGTSMIAATSPKLISGGIRAASSLGEIASDLAGSSLAAPLKGAPIVDQLQKLKDKFNQRRMP